MNKRAVIFDLGGVIFPSPVVQLAKLRPLDRQATVAIGDLECGTLSRDEYQKKFRDAKGVEIIRVIEEAVRRPNHVMLDVVDSIRARGIKVGFITNDWEGCFGDAIKTKIEPRADALVRSHQVGLRKPDPAIYRRALEVLSMKPEESVFLDDIGANLKAAKELGMTAIRCNTLNVDEVDDEALKQLDQAVGFETCPTDSLPHDHRHAIDAQSVERFLKGKNILSQDQRISSYRKFKQGQSNPTYVLTCTGSREPVGNKPHGGSGDEDETRRIVLRKKPSGVTLPTAHRVDREYRLLSALGKNTNVPVPKTLALCKDDPSVVGSDCYFMEMVESRNIIDPNLPFFSCDDASKMYNSLCDTLVALHQVDYKAIGLEGFGKPEKFFERQLDRWSAQFKAEVGEDPSGQIPEMNELETYLRKEIGTVPNVPPSIIHGDFRIDNVLFHPFRPEVVSVLDVELATIGHPFSDVALLTVYHDVVRDGFLGPKPRGECNPGIPSDLDFVERYLSRMQSHLSNTSPASTALSPLVVPNWNVITAFCYWRIAAIFHGVYHRSKLGNASSPRASTFGKAVPILAQKGLVLANKPAAKVGMQ